MSRETLHARLRAWAEPIVFGVSLLVILAVLFISVPVALGMAS